MEKLDAQVVALITPSVKKRLQASAKRNGRSLSGETRYILTQAMAKVRA